MQPFTVDVAIDHDRLGVVEQDMFEHAAEKSNASRRPVCGDALDEASYEALLGRQTASMLFSDPPYNVRVNGHVGGKGVIQHPEFAMASGEMSTDEFTQFLTTFCKLAARFTADGSIHYVCMDWRHLPEVLASWLDAYFSELTSFPKARHDDQVDSTSQFLEWASAGAGTTGLIEFYRREVERLNQN